MADVAMAKKEEQESQEAPALEPTEVPSTPSEPMAAGPTLPQLAPRTGGDEIAQDELAQFREWQKQRAEAKAHAAPTSPPKKQRTDDEEDMAEFEVKLVDLDINFADLDPELQNKLRSSKSSRRDFLAIHTTDRLYNPTDGTWSEQPTTKKRDFGSITERAMPNLTAEDNVQQAMLQYHQKSILPSLDQLQMCCDQFYKMAQHEFAMTQYTLDRHSSQLQVLERSKANKTILLLDLPPIFNKKTLDANVGYYLQAAGLQWDQVAAMHNHMVSSASSLVRLEFLTEQQAAQFRDQMRQGRRYWRDPQQQDHKIRIEQDQPLEDRLAMQPYYALLEVLAELYVEETGEDTHASLQTWRQTLQIWTPKGVEPKQLIGQVSYVLDPRFARRYSCLLLVHDRFYDAALTRWHAKFSRRLRDTLFLAQALKRATSDRTTVQRASYDKAFDLTTASHAQAFPYTVMPVRISDDLASMLESHPMLPFQGAGGMTALTAQAFLDRDQWTPQMGKGSSHRSSYQGWSQKSGWSDYNTYQKPKDKGQAKGQWKERDHDSRTNWKKDDDQDNNDSWGAWGSGPWAPSRTPKGPIFGGSGKGSPQQQTQHNKGKGHSHIQPVFICEHCSCALGYCIDCPKCKEHPVPPGFMWKDTVPWKNR
ncbi:unnamed protein product [Symbiodinium sp. CCMP2592]|nr:unnamed protein product [Symbiodinium sp. CCMP2592]